MRTPSLFYPYALSPCVSASSTYEPVLHPLSKQCPWCCHFFTNDGDQMFEHLAHLAIGCAKLLEMANSTITLLSFSLPLLFVAFLLFGRSLPPRSLSPGYSLSRLECFDNPDHDLGGSQIIFHLGWSLSISHHSSKSNFFPVCSLYN